MVFSGYMPRSGIAGSYARGPTQFLGQALITITPIKPPIKGITAQASGSTSPTRGQTPEARGTTILQPAESRPQHSKFDKMRQQKNMLQMKEQDKNLQELNEEEISNLSEKEFRVIIVKMT